MRERGRGARRRFLVRYVGWGPEEDTWCSRADLQHAPDILEQWERDRELGPSA